jgi:hypothetical protein
VILTILNRSFKFVVPVAPVVTVAPDNEDVDDYDLPPFNYNSIDPYDVAGWLLIEFERREKAMRFI